MTVCPCSTTGERPLRNRSSCWFMPLVSRPTRALTTKMPPSASTNHRASAAHLPWVGTDRLKVLANVCQSSSSGWPSVSVGSTSARAAVTPMISTSETTASQPIRLDVPRDMVLSNQYRSRERLRAFEACVLGAMCRYPLIHPGLSWTIRHLPEPSASGHTVMGPAPFSAKSRRSAAPFATFCRFRWHLARPCARVSSDRTRGPAPRIYRPDRGAGPTRPGAGGPPSTPGRARSVRTGSGPASMG